MPKDYEAILKNVTKSHPKLGLAERKTMAAKITNSRRKKSGRPPAKFHRGKG